MAGLGKEPGCEENRGVQPRALPVPDPGRALEVCGKIAVITTLHLMVTYSCKKFKKKKKKLLIFRRCVGKLFTLF